MKTCPVCKQSMPGSDPAPGKGDPKGGPYGSDKGGAARAAAALDHARMMKKKGKRA